MTIIFLPLSAVASILGMNVNDVRNMEFNQWIFWATALPLTVVIIILCLIWAGELENFWIGFRNLWRRTPRPQTYSGGARPAYMQVQATPGASGYDPVAAAYERGKMDAEYGEREKYRVLGSRPRRRAYFEDRGEYDGY